MAGPITCQPFAKFPHMPTYHIIGHVTNSSKGIEVEHINDVSGVFKYKGVYHGAYVPRE